MKYKNEDANISKDKNIGYCKPNCSKKSNTNDTRYCWPSLIMFLLILVEWIRYYDTQSITSFLVFINMMIFSALCIIVAVYFLLKKNNKKCISFILPVIVATFVGITPINLILKNIPSWPHEEIIAHSRHYVEFIIQKNKYIPEITRITNEAEYKEWKIVSNPLVTYKIVFDVTDKVINKNGMRSNDSVVAYRVYKVGEHFYMVEEAIVKAFFFGI